MDPDQLHGKMPGNTVPIPGSSSGLPNMAMHMGATGHLMQQPTYRPVQSSTGQTPDQQDPSMPQIGQTTPVHDNPTNMQLSLQLFGQSMTHTTGLPQPFGASVQQHAGLPSSQQVVDPSPIPPLGMYSQQPMSYKLDQFFLHQRLTQPRQLEERSSIRNCNSVPPQINQPMRSRASHTVTSQMLQAGPSQMGRSQFHAGQPFSSQLDRPGTSYTDRPNASYTDRSSTSYVDPPCTSYMDRPGSSYTDRPGSSYTDRPGSSYTDRPGTSYMDRPGTSYMDRPGTSYIDRPGTSYLDRPGTSYMERISSSYIDRPGTLFLDRPGTSYMDRPGTSFSSTSQMDRLSTSYIDRPGTSYMDRPGTSYMNRSTSQMDRPNTPQISQSSNKLSQRAHAHTGQYRPPYPPQIGRKIQDPNQPGSSKALTPTIQPNNQDTVDHISKVKSLFPMLKDTVETTMTNASNIAMQNHLEDKNSHLQNVLYDDIVTNTFNKNMENIFKMCDQIESSLKSAKASLEQEQAPSRNLPQEIPTTEAEGTPDEDARQQYLVTVRVQVGNTQEIQNTLGAQNKSPPE